jgi:hypothetical protein
MSGCFFISSLNAAVNGSPAKPVFEISKKNIALSSCGYIITCGF